MKTNNNDLIQFKLYLGLTIAINQDFNDREHSSPSLSYLKMSVLNNPYSGAV